MFDPVMNHFLQQDPTGFNAGDSNLYRYESNNPITLEDPSGLAPPPVYPASGFFTTCPNSGNADAFDRMGAFDPPTRDDLYSNIPLQPSRPLPPGTVTGTGTRIPGGSHSFYGPLLPNHAAGTNGANTCIAIIIRCGTNVAVFHFGANEDIPGTLSKYSWTKTCVATVFGGNVDPISRWALNVALHYLKSNGIKTNCLPGVSSAIVDSTGTFWTYDPKSEIDLR